MIIDIKVKPGSKEEKIKKIDETHFEVSLKERAEKGKVNVSLIKTLVKYLNVTSSQIKIKSGFASHNKIVEVI
jgi:uncharacterized protein YggU (UPF0235/DUF167 family)